MRSLLSFSLLIALGVSSNSSFAIFPICTTSSLTGKANSIMTPVRYYGPKDRRGRLSEKAAEFKLGKAEISQIRKSFGIVFCQPDKAKKPFVGGGFLAQNNCEIWTVGHNLQNDDGTPIDPKDCGFQNFEIPGRRTPFDVTSSRNIIPWVTDGSRGKIDRARLRLKNCIPEAKPFRVENASMPQGTEFITIMAANADLPIGNEPILGVGKVESVDTLNDGTRLLYTSNDGDRGASGGIDVVRVNGKLTVRAMHIQIASSLDNLKPGDPANGAPYDRSSNYNVHLELSGPVKDALSAP